MHAGREQHLWAADGIGGRCIRVARGGDIVDEIRAPEGLGIFARMLGGDDGRTLLLCAAPDYFEANRRDARRSCSPPASRYLTPVCPEGSGPRGTGTIGPAPT